MHWLTYSAFSFVTAWITRKWRRTGYPDWFCCSPWISIGKDSAWRVWRTFSLASLCIAKRETSPDSTSWWNLVRLTRAVEGDRLLTLQYCRTYATRCQGTQKSTFLGTFSFKPEFFTKSGFCHNSLSGWKKVSFWILRYSWKLQKIDPFPHSQMSSATSLKHSF